MINFCFQTYLIIDLYFLSKTGILIFQNLDERINYVAAKIIHVGNQLQSINTPRSRTVQVHKLMGYLEDFMSPGPLTADIFNDPTKVKKKKTIVLYIYLCKLNNLMCIYVNLNFS